MKRVYLLIAAAALLGMALWWVPVAVGQFGATQNQLVATNLIPSQVINNGTTNSGSYSQSSALNVSPATFTMINSGLTATNQYTGNAQVSLDNVNWVTLGIYHPTITNAQADVFQPSFNSATVYVRMQIVTTTNVTGGATVVHLK